MPKMMKRRVLSDLFPIRTPDDLLREVLDSVRSAGPGDPGRLVPEVFDLSMRLYRGQWDGYLACDTPYHDMWHVAEVFLTMGRLINGALLKGTKFTAREIALGLTAAILHDAGYIRHEMEKVGQGACFRMGHERRSMAFLERHADLLSLSTEEIEDCAAMIQSTIIAEDIENAPFRTASVALLGRMLAVADLLSQLASATYLEKLVDLYEEDQGDAQPHFADLKDCFRKAITFDGFARERLRAVLPAADAYLEAHFKMRWKHPENLYAVASRRQKNRLAELLEQSSFEPRHHLRRWGSLADMRRIFV